MQREVPAGTLFPCFGLLRNVSRDVWKSMHTESSVRGARIVPFVCGDEHYILDLESFVSPVTVPFESDLEIARLWGANETSAVAAAAFAAVFCLCGNCCYIISLPIVYICRTTDSNQLCVPRP